MSVLIDFEDAAEADLEHLFEWFESHCPGRGTRFIFALDDTLAYISLIPTGYQIYDGMFIVR